MGEIDLKIQGGQIVTPYDLMEGNLYINQGKVVGLGKLDVSCNQVVDAGGLLLLPGMVDAHVHFMDPGDTSREDFPNGSAAAAVAGVTTVIEHNHACPVYTGDDFRKKVGHLKNRSVVDFGLGAHLLPNGLEGVEDAIREGATFVKVFTCTTHGVNGAENGPLFKAMNLLKKHGTVFLVHAEDESLTETAEAELRASGREDGGVIPEWRSRLAEQVAVNAVAQLTLASKAHVVIAHCSHSYIVDILLNYRSQGAHIWAESCPQYFFLKEEEVHPMKGFRKFTPPARAVSSEDIQSMWERLRNGRISYLSSDHAPATPSQKQEGSIWTVPFGLPGIDTTLPLMLDAVSKGYLNYPRLVEVYSKIPACLYGLYPRKGSLHIGSDADFVLVDPEATWTLEDKNILSKAKWTPYAGYPLKGRVVASYVRGLKVAEGGRCIGPPGWGQFVPGKGFNRRGKD